MFANTRSGIILSFYGVKGRTLHRHCKHFLCDYLRWNQRSYAKEWLLFPYNLGAHLSIDEPELLGNGDSKKQLLARGRSAL